MRLGEALLQYMDLWRAAWPVMNRYRWKAHVLMPALEASWILLLLIGCAVFSQTPPLVLWLFPPAYAVLMLGVLIGSFPWRLRESFDVAPVWAERIRVRHLRVHARGLRQAMSHSSVCENGGARRRRL